MSDYARGEQLSEFEPPAEPPYVICPRCDRPWSRVTRYRVTGVWARTSADDPWAHVLGDAGSEYHLFCQQEHLLRVRWEMIAPELQDRLDPPDIGGEMRFERSRGAASLREPVRDGIRPLLVSE